MANQEHLDILKQGAAVWTKWRQTNHHIRPDLFGANLSRANLSWMDLSGTNLNGAVLEGTELNNANLSRANFSKADLRMADLSRTSLNRAVLSEADVRSAYLDGADLSRASLRMGDLREASLVEANLSGADVYLANLSGAKLIGADLSEADISGADLIDADLWFASLEKADLQQADLRYCRLIRANMSQAILTGAKLHGTARDDWIIKDVKCKYVYWDEKGEQRFPRDRDFGPGEFERLYAVLPTIEYIFENGMSPLDLLIMERVVQAIRKKRPEFDTKIDSINERGTIPSIKFTVQNEDHKEPALEEVQKEYEARIKLLKAERDRYYQLVSRAIDTPKNVKLINAAPGSFVLDDGSTISIEQHIHNALELQKAVLAEPEVSKSFAKVAKKTALDIIGGAIKDIAKGQVKEAAKEIVKLGRDLGPIIAKTAAYVFFKSIG